MHRLLHHPESRPRPVTCRLVTWRLVAIAWLLLLSGSTRAAAFPSLSPSPPPTLAHRPIELPAVVLTDEAGRRVTLASDVMRDRVVVMNFIFTSCPAICPPMGATFARVASRLDGRPVRLVSVSVDPESDTPARLAEWKARFTGATASGARDGAAWTLLTGAKEEIDRLRKALGVYTADPFSHTPTTIVIDARDGHDAMTRVNGLASADEILSAIDTLAAGRPAGSESAGGKSASRSSSSRSASGGSAGGGSAGRTRAGGAQVRVTPASVAVRGSSAPTPAPAQMQPALPSPSPRRLQDGGARYFAGLSLVDQTGRTVRLYEDLIAGHTVLVHSFFTDCHGSCPIMTGTLVSLQKRFADRLGRSLRFVSISVDPANDTPEKLRAYARTLGARDGWYFLTGSPEAVEAALKKLGQYAATREAHTNVMIVGNEPTGLWKKLHGLSDARELGDIVAGVLEDATVAEGAAR